MDLRCAFMALAVLSLDACGGVVDARGGGADDEPGPGAGGRGDPSTMPPGLACRYLHGHATLTSYTQGDYATSAFSFEYASQDPAVTLNEFDVLYEADLFVVNTVTDDRSFLVDLGALLLRDAPANVDPDDYPLGAWQQHDALQAQLGHAYFVRSVDDAGQLTSAFRVESLAPGSAVGIEWIRSSDPERLIVPDSCM